MRTKAGWLCGIVVMVALALPFAGNSLAQTTTVEMKNFEVIAVSGDKLIFRDPTGTREITVPADFRFTIDGKKMALSELKPGMKGTATVTTTTTVVPVFVTELREAEVLKASDMSMTLRGADGNTKRFTQGELNKRNIEIFKDGKEVRIADLKKGDKLSAVIITAAAPAVLTEQEVKATLAEAAPAAAPTQMAAATPPATSSATPAAAAPPATTSAPPAAAAPAATPAPAPAPAPAASPAPMAPKPAAEPAGMSTMTWLLIAIAIAAVLFFFLRRKKEA